MSEETNEQSHRVAVHPHGYKMADEEMERLEQKRESDDVLDPIALQDPVGVSVEKAIGRVLVAVVFVLVVGILFAQVACKNIQLWGVPSFSTGVTNATVEKALASGVSWAGEIVRFPKELSHEYDASSSTVRVVVHNTSQRTLSTLVDASQSQAFALAMALFAGKDVNRLEYTVAASVDQKTGGLAPSSSEDPNPVVTIVWERGEDGKLACLIDGFDPLTKTTTNQE